MKNKKNKALISIFLVLILLLSACGQKTDEKPKEENTKVEEKKVEEIKRDETTGLEIVSEDEMKFAKSLKITRLQDGYILVDMAGGEDVVLLVPKDKEKLDVADFTQVFYPAENIGAYSTTHVALINAIGHLDKVGSVNMKVDNWHIDEVKKAMEDVKIAFVGNSFDLDYEMVQSVSPDMVITSGAKTEKAEKSKTKLQELGIPTFGVYQHIENDPRGRIEWVKFFGILVGDEETANKYFDDQIARIAKIEEENKSLDPKPTIVNFRAGEDGITVKREEDYSVRMLEMAGGTYGLAGMVEKGTGTYKISPEEFYKSAEKVDILIHENKGKRVDSIENLLAFGDYLVDLKAVQDEKVYTTNANYWQAMDKTAEMIEELNLIIKGEAPDKMEFYKRIK